MGFVIKVNRRILRCESDQVFPDDDDGHTRRSDIFLRTCPDHAESADIHFLTENAGGHIRNQRNISGIRNIREFGAVNRVVIADVHIVRIRSEIFSADFRDVAVGVLLGAGNTFDVAEFAGFLVRLLRPLPGYNVVCLFGFSQQIERNHGELQCTAALQEQDFVVIRNVHQFTQIRLGVFNNRLELR